MLTVAGCGGGVSHGAFVKRADAVCGTYRSRVTPLPRPRSYSQVVAYVNRTLPLYEGALRALHALVPPKGDADAVHAWLAADGRVAAALRSLGAAAERRDFPSVSAAAVALERASAGSRTAASALGLHVCSSGR